MPINAALISKDFVLLFSSFCVHCHILSIKNVCFIGRALQDELDMDNQTQESAPSENVVRLRVVLENFQPMMTSSVKELRCAGLLLDTYGLDMNLPNASQPSTLSDQSTHRPLSCQITVLCNDIQLVLIKLKYAIYRDEVYKMAAA